MLAQELVCFGIKNAHVRGIPLDVDELADPAWRRAVVGRLDFDTTVQMHDALTVLVVTERFDRQRQEEWLFLCKHGRDLTFGRSVNAGIGPTRFPLIQVGLGLFQTFKALSLQRRLLCMSDSTL